MPPSEDYPILPSSPNGSMQGSPTDLLELLAFLLTPLGGDGWSLKEHLS